MSLDRLKAKMKDWEDRFLLIYKRRATMEDVQKNPKVEQVYNEIKRLQAQRLEPIKEARGEEFAEVKPSPFKPAGRGLFRSLSFSNERRSTSFLKRIQEDTDEGDAKRQKTDDITPSKSTSAFFESDKAASQPSLGIQIDESPIEKDQKYAIRKMLMDTANVLPSAKRWFKSSTPKKSFAKETLEVFKSPFKPSRSVPQTKLDAIPMNIPRPSKFSNKNSLRRQNSFTFGELPTNYNDFLSKDEVEKFSDVITGINNSQSDSVNVHEAFEQSHVEADSKVAMVAPRPKKNVPATPKRTKRRVDVEKIVMDSDSDSDSDARTVHDEESDDAKTPVKSKPKKKQIPKRNPKSETTVVRAKPDEGNYRAFKLKPKKGGPSKQKFGRSRFQKQRKLSSYSYQKSDGTSLAAGYDDDNDNIIKVDGSSNGPSGHGQIDFIVDGLDSVSSNCVTVTKNDVIGSNFCVDLDKALKSLTGHTSYCLGQLESITSILQNKSTLLVLPTSGGKSLCYQIPAFIFKHAPNSQISMVLVISPTTSLISDQVRCLPKHLRGAFLSRVGQTDAQAKDQIQQIYNGAVDILFISPERVRTDSFAKIARNPKFPKISFVCVDEAHCLSEWSHNFRTSYLYLEAELSKLFNVSCYLALTGTATSATTTSICQMLKIEPENVNCFRFIAENLQLTSVIVPPDENKEDYLVNFLKNPQHSLFKSIIIYVMFQVQADRLAQFLRIRQIDADSYHAGRSPEERTMVQGKFVRGHLKVIVATVAFGMGINKSDVDAVIHYCLPKSIENYVQEIGRAGRDGRNSVCHLFLSATDYVRHRSLCFSNGAAKPSIVELLSAIFSTEKRILTLELSKIERELDIREDVLNTILVYLEFKFSRAIKVRPKTDSVVTLYLINGITLEYVESEMEGLKLAEYAQHTKGAYVINIFEASLGSNVDPTDLVSLFWELQAAKKLRFKMESPVIPIYIEDRIKVDFESIASEVEGRLLQIERIQVLKLDELYECIYQVAFANISQLEAAESETLRAKKDQVSTKLLQYFERSLDEEHAECLITRKGKFRDPLLVKQQKDCEISLDIAIKAFIRENASQLESGRTIARIFHGLSSPKYLAQDWNREDCWGKYIHINFEDLTRRSQKALENYRNKQKNT